MTERCRLCGGALKREFDADILNRYHISFLKCEICQSLQTEKPYWLTEAYCSAIAASDTGAVIRNLVCQAAITRIAQVLQLDGRLLDFGGGSGLLCRMLRDRGFDAYMYDKFADPLYSGAYFLQPHEAQKQEIDLVSAVEVFEHCDSPAEQLAELFAIRPKVLVATTVQYEGYGPEWWYLSLRTGQHVFFYSNKAMNLIAERFGYSYFNRGTFHIFTKEPLSPAQKFKLRFALSNAGLRFARIWISASQGGKYAEADHQWMNRNIE